MKKGAFDFLLESCSDRRLTGAIDEACRWNAVCRQQIAVVQSARRRMDRLSPALRVVLDLLLRGHSNREIAAELNLSERTIEDRRAKIMRAMKVRTVVGLVRQALLAEGGVTHMRVARPGCWEAQIGQPPDGQTCRAGDAEALTADLFAPRGSRPSSAVAASQRSRRPATRKRVRVAQPVPNQDLIGQDRKHDRQPKRAR